MQAAHMELDQVVDVREEAGRIVTEPQRNRPRYTLEELVAQCRRNKRRSREEQEWLDAPSVGRETL
jgi:antitoxin ChpS